MESANHAPLAVLEDTLKRLMDRLDGEGLVSWAKEAPGSRRAAATKLGVSTAVARIMRVWAGLVISVGISQQWHNVSVPWFSHNASIIVTALGELGLQAGIPLFRSCLGP